MTDLDKPASTTVTLSVGELASHLLRAGDLSSEYRGAKRAIDGIRLHQQIQAQRPAGYQSEVAVSFTATFDTIELTLSGRIDGIQQPQADPVIIEEIKSSYGDVSAMTHYQAVHWGQLQCYGFMYAAQHCLAEVQLQLTYGQIGGHGQRQFQQVVTYEALQATVIGWLKQYARWLSRIFEWRQRRNQSIQQTVFPFPDYRLGQRNMAVAVYRTLQNRGQTFVQAPTGVGKTIAAIFPTLKAMPERLVDRFFYLTARTTGRTAAEAALQRLRADGLCFKSLSLTAKEKICPNDTPDCRAAACDYARGHFDRIDQARWQLFEHDDFTAELLLQIADAHQVCPFELSIDLARWTDGLIGDYNYVFDPRVSLKSLWAEGSDDLVFLVDEAHNLVDRSREMFSAELHRQSFEVLLAEIPATMQRLQRLTTQIMEQFTAFASRPRQAEAVHWHDSPPGESFLNQLIQFLVLADHWLARNSSGALYDCLLNLYFKVHTFLKVTEAYDDSYQTYDEILTDDLKIKLWCVDPAVQMAAVLSHARATLFFSATLSPWTFFQRLFGCQAQAVGLQLPSPFPGHNLAVLAMTHVSTRYKDRQHTKDQVARAILTFIGQKSGNYLVFLPSYAYLEMIHDELKLMAPDHPFLSQESRMTELARSTFLDRFNDPRANPVTALAVMGGIFGEGIDLRGERLTGAAIVGVGLPGISAERQKMRDYYHAHDGLGFEFAYAYPGVTRVLQAAGRVIRSATDKGAVLLIDDRYGRAPYRHLLPEHWQPQWLSSNSQLQNRLNRFWAPTAGP